MKDYVKYRVKLEFKSRNYVRKSTYDDIINEIMIRGYSEYDANVVVDNALRDMQEIVRENIKRMKKLLKDKFDE